MATGDPTCTINASARLTEVLEAIQMSNIKHPTDFSTSFVGSKIIVVVTQGATPADTVVHLDLTLDADSYKWPWATNPTETIDLRGLV